MEYPVLDQSKCYLLTYFYFYLQLHLLITFGSFLVLVNYSKREIIDPRLPWIDCPLRFNSSLIFSDFFSNSSFVNGINSILFILFSLSTSVGSILILLQFFPNIFI